MNITTPEQSEKLSGKILKYTEIDEQTGEPTGREASFLGVEFQGLQYSHLIEHTLGTKVTVPLSWENARLIDTNIDEITADKVASGKLTLESDYSTRTIGLVRNGWLPSGLAIQDNMTVIPDRCTVKELVSRFHNGKKKDETDKDFLDLFADQRFRINPLLYALEGNRKANPTHEIVEQQYEEASTKIKSSLPLAEVVPMGQVGLQGIVGIINDTQAGMARKQEFLIRLAPTLRSPVSANRLRHVWREVLAAADDCKVSRYSLIVIAALSAVSIPNGKSPAKALLKLTKPNYSSELAYNALADLRSLEVLMFMFALFPEERLLLCTGDKDLALFWAGIRASGFTLRENHLQFKLSPIEALLPNVTTEQREFYSEVEENTHGT